MRYRLWFTLVALLGLPARALVAQPAPGRVALSGQLVVARSGELESVDVGLGARVAWYPVALVGIDAEGNGYPGGFPHTRAGFSRGRLEGLVGVTVGPRLERVRPFASVHVGFLVFRPPSEPLACVLVYPPPLACTLASGRTVPAFEVGGGAEVMATSRAFLRVDVGDRVLRYPGPSRDGRGRVRMGAFFGHGVRLASAAGVRF